MARRTTRKSVDEEIDDLVAGRTRLTPDKLVELINSVNPTDRGLSARERDERYQQKSRLQSLLIRQHPELVRLSRVDETIVALSLDGTGRHAAHARLDALDDVARSWVQRRLDTASPEADPSAPRPSVPGGAPRPPQESRARELRVLEPDDAVRPLIVAGDTAMEAFDYETARECYEAATRDGTSREAYARLFALLVDVLVADEEALALGTRTAARIVEHPPIRAALATAEARSGSVPRARALLATLDVPAAALAWVELGARALRDGDLEAAISDVARARALDSGLGSLASVEHRIEIDRQAQLSGLEASLAVLVTAGDDDAVLDRACAILAKYPTSRVAAAAKRRIEGTRDEGAARERLERARERALKAAEASELEAALGAMRAAETPRVRAQPNELAALIERLGQLRADADASGIVRALESESTRADGLLVWLGASADVRSRVREQWSGVELAWLAELAAAATASRAKGAVRAVLEFARARSALAREAHAEARSLLDEHWPVLRGLPAAVEARRTLDAARAERVRCALAEVEAAVAAGDDVRAAAVADPLATEALESADRADLAKLRAGIEARTSRRNARSTLDRALAAGAFIDARRALRDVQSTAEPSERGDLDALSVCIEDWVRASHALMVLEGPVAELDGRDLDPCTEMWRTALDDGGRRAVVASFYGDRAFLRIFELTSERSPALPVRCIALRTPFGLDHGSISIANDHITIVSGLGERLLVDWHGTTIVDVQPALRAALSRQVIRSSLVADGSTIWVQGYTKEDLSDLMLQVIDARTGRVRNTVAGCRAYSFYPGERGLRIWAQNEGRLGRMDLEGRLIDPQIAIAGKLVSFNAAVEDDGVWTLSVERELGLEFGPILTRFDENGRRRAGLRLGDAIGSVWSELSAVRGGCFLRARGDAAVCRVWAIRDHGDGLEVAWAFDAPDSAALVDSIAGDAVCLLHQARPLAMWPLALDAPPPMPAGPSDTDEAVTPNFALFTRPRPTDPAIAELFTEARRALREHVRTGGLESHIGRELARADAKTLWAHALAIDDAHAIQALRLFERATVLAPTERAIARDRAQLCIAIGRFAEAITIIERALARGAADANVCLELPLAAAQYCIEDLQRARMTLAAALERIAPTHPNRAACASFAAFLDDAYGSRAHETRVGRRVRALVEAQRLAAAGDLPGAIGVADIADVWRPRESGALALLADLWRALEPATPAEHVRRSLVLAAAAAPSSEPRGVLVVPRSPERST